MLPHRRHGSLGSREVNEMKLPASEKVRRLLADIGHRNASTARSGPVWTQSCDCDGRHVRTLYGMAVVAVPRDGLDEIGAPEAENNACKSGCGYVRMSERILNERGREVSFKKLKKFFGDKIEVAGRTDRVAIGDGEMNARLVATVLRGLDAKRVKVAVVETVHDLGTPSLHIGASDGSWLVQIAGMRKNRPGEEMYEDPTRRASFDDLAGRRRRH